MQSIACFHKTLPARYKTMALSLSPLSQNQDKLLFSDLTKLLQIRRSRYTIVFTGYSPAHN